MEKYAKDDIRKKYERFAKWYDLFELLPEILGVSFLRRMIIKKVSKKTIEIAVGTGKNLKYYPRNIQLTAIDYSPEMLELAKRKANKLGLKINFKIMDAENLSFADNTFNTVVSTLTLCTYPNPLTALKEMSRVCNPNGRIILIEHGKSNVKWFSRYQDRTAEKRAKHIGCFWNREPLKLVQKAGLKIVKFYQKFFGIFTGIEAVPIKNS